VGACTSNHVMGACASNHSKNRLLKISSSALMSSKQFLKMNCYSDSHLKYGNWTLNCIKAGLLILILK